MPPSSWLPVFEVLARYGISHTTTQDIAKNDLRNWELEEIDRVLKKVQVPHRGYCYFRAPFLKATNQETVNFRTLWPSLWATGQDSRWMSPPRELMHRSVQEQAALCVNAKGEWSLRTSGVRDFRYLKLPEKSMPKFKFPEDGTPANIEPCPVRSFVARLDRGPATRQRAQRTPR